jgi:hypothetical protein
MFADNAILSELDSHPLTKIARDIKTRKAALLFAKSQNPNARYLKQKTSLRQQPR